MLNWLLKEYAKLLAQPVGVILNSSFMEQKLPSVWKLVDITPLSKDKQVLDPKKELRPISLTSAFFKIAEDFVVSDCIKPALKKVVDLNHFGNISGSSTVLVLISMVYKWLEATDGPGATVRVFLSDHCKAFDLIDHSFLVTKLKLIKVPNISINWIIDFVSDRSQRVKLNKDCLSEWGKAPSGVLQGTKLAPGLDLTCLSPASSTCGNMLMTPRYRRPYPKIIS